MPKGKGKKAHAMQRERRRRLSWGLSLGAGALVLGAALVLGVMGLGAQRASAAPAWTATSTDGEQIGSDAYAGDVYVLDFFFLTCGICELQLPENKKMVDQLANRSDFHFVSITADPADTRPRIEAHREDKNATWPHVRDTYGLYQKFKVRGNPNLVFIDREGNVALTVTELAQGDYLLRNALKLLEGDAVEAPQEGETRDPEHAPTHTVSASLTPPLLLATPALGLHKPDFAGRGASARVAAVWKRRGQ